MENTVDVWNQKKIMKKETTKLKLKIRSVQALSAYFKITRYQTLASMHKDLRNKEIIE